MKTITLLTLIYLTSWYAGKSYVDYRMPTESIAYYKHMVGSALPKVELNYRVSLNEGE